MLSNITRALRLTAPRSIVAAVTVTAAVRSASLATIYSSRAFSTGVDGAAAPTEAGAVKKKTVLRQVLTSLPGSRGADLRRFVAELDEVEPYRFAVFKVGGAVLDGAELDALTHAVSVFAQLDLLPIIVHGSGPQLNAELEAAGVTPNYIGGVRVTDEATLEVAIRVFGESNAKLVDALEARGVRAAPLHGVFEAELLDENTYGLVGKVTRVHDKRVRAAIAHGQVPCVSSLGVTRSGQMLNINADIAARELALKVRPLNVCYLNAGAGGLYDASGEVIATINLAEDYDDLMAQPWVRQGTRLKIDEIKAILDGLPPASSVSIVKAADLVSELFSRSGKGTLVRNGERMLRYDTVEEVRANVDMQALRTLFESAFGGRLKEGYFESLLETHEDGRPSRLAHLYVTESMRAAAVITREPNAPEGALYMDKVAVHNSFRGFGIAQLLWQRICNDIETLFWRSRAENPFNSWYYRVCDGSFSTEKWVVFFYGLRKLRDGEKCVATAISMPSTIERGPPEPSPSLVPKRKTTPAPRIRRTRKQGEGRRA